MSNWNMFGNTLPPTLKNEIANATMQMQVRMGSKPVLVNRSTRRVTPKIKKVAKGGYLC